MSEIMSNDISKNSMLRESENLESIKIHQQVRKSSAAKLKGNPSSGNRTGIVSLQGEEITIVLSMLTLFSNSMIL
jgi:hypothetical protein